MFGDKNRMRKINDSSALRLLRESRLAHLATSTKDGTPHVIPICFALDGRTIYSSIDEKPKRADANRLRRVLNIIQNPRVCLVVDYYSENWNNLSYVIVNGYARIMHGGREHKRAVSLLRKKYRQYLLMRIENRPIVKIKPSKIVTWRARECGIQNESGRSMR